MPLPMAFAAFGIFIPGSVLAGKTIDQNVRPAVVVEVIDKREKVVRIRVVDAERGFEGGDLLLGAIGFLVFERCVGGIILMAFFEIRPLIPVGAGHDVHFAVVVEVAKVGALAPEFVGQLDFFKGVKKMVLG